MATTRSEDSTNLAFGVTGLEDLLIEAQRRGTTYNNHWHGCLYASNKNSNEPLEEKPTDQLQSLPVDSWLCSSWRQVEEAAVSFGRFPLPLQPEKLNSLQGIPVLERHGPAPRTNKSHGELMQTWLTPAGRAKEPGDPSGLQLQWATAQLMIHSQRNLLLYGLGDKASLLEQLTAQFLIKRYSFVAVLRALSTGCNLETFFEQICTELASRQAGNNKPVSRRRRGRLATEHNSVLQSGTRVVRSNTRVSTTEAAMQAVKRFCGSDNPDNEVKSQGTRTRRVCLVVYPIDAPQICNREAQRALSMIAKLKPVQLITCADSIHFPFIWDNKTIERYQFVYVYCPTLMPFGTDWETGTNRLTGAVASLHHNEPYLPLWFTAAHSNASYPSCEAIMTALASLAPKYRELYRELVRQCARRDATGSRGSTFRREQVAGECVNATSDSSGEEVHATIPATESYFLPWVHKEVLFQSSRHNMIFTDLAKFDCAIGELQDHRLVEVIAMPTSGSTLSRCKQGVRSSKTTSTVAYRLPSPKSVLLEAMPDVLLEVDDGTDSENNGDEDTNNNQDTELSHSGDYVSDNNSDENRNPDNMTAV